MSCDGCQRFRRYYMLGFRDFVMARDFEDLWASDAAGCFLALVEEKLQKQPDCILPIIDDLLPAMRFVSRNQALFDAKESIYGNFHERLARIQELVQKT